MSLWVVDNLVKKQVFEMNLTYNDKKKYTIVYENRMPIFHENKKVFEVKIKLPNERITKYQYKENEQAV